MSNKNILFKQIFVKTQNGLNQSGAPIRTMIDNYYKVKDNYNIYYKNNKENFDLLTKIQTVIKENKNLGPITIVRSEKLSENIMDFIIITILLEVITFFAENEHSMLDISEYITGIGEIPITLHKKLLLADLRNLYIRKEQEQEIYIEKLFKLMNKRKTSTLYNLIIINDTLKDLIESNQQIKNSIQNTILFT